MVFLSVLSPMLSQSQSVVSHLAQQDSDRDLDNLKSQKNTTACKSGPLGANSYIITRVTLLGLLMEVARGAAGRGVGRGAVDHAYASYGFLDDTDCLRWFSKSLRHLRHIMSVLPDMMRRKSAQMGVKPGTRDRDDGKTRNHPRTQIGSMAGARYCGSGALS